ncbi:hypothetical protein K502DRAFT_323150 [Neoconidiobolus thromboides FSU 785]|nr:hypothetical protein K502DRAFT_323150 [Neoconidiobolus thromboides FSU 785]
MFTTFKSGSNFPSGFQPSLSFKTEKDNGTKKEPLELEIVLKQYQQAKARNEFNSIEAYKPQVIEAYRNHVRAEANVWEKEAMKMKIANKEMVIMFYKTKSLEFRKLFKEEEEIKDSLDLNNSNITKEKLNNDFDQIDKKEKNKGYLKGLIEKHKQVEKDERKRIKETYKMGRKDDIRLELSKIESEKLQRECPGAESAIEQASRKVLDDFEESRFIASFTKSD